MNAPSQDLDQHRQHCEQLIAAQQTVLLATASTQGVPLNSYAPFVRDDKGVFYVFLSELAEHTRNLMDNPQASLFFIRPESESKNLFARERVSFACHAQRIGRDSPRFDERMAVMTERFGDTIQLLQSLADFHLFALTPNRGTYVVGFGQAFLIDPQSGDFSHIKNPSKG